ncbi:MAG: alpha/beta hydrolase [Bacteroidota bacterium]
MKLYAIPGLGTDRRIFSALKDFLPFDVIDWLPTIAGEGLSSYATRMAEALPHGPVNLLGLSFGGVVAQEIAGQRPVNQIILLSSIRTPDELPLQMQMFRWLPLYQLARGNWRVKSLPLWSPWFGITDRREQKLLQDMFSTFTDRDRMWAIDAMIHWSGPTHSAPLTHIHGGKDKVFPISRLQPDHVIPDGNHFMVHQKAAQIGPLILKILQKNS